MNKNPYINKECSLHCPTDLNGNMTTDVKPGDFILVRYTHSFYASLIRFGQSLRFRGADSKYRVYSHTAFVVSPDGDIVEALGNGIVRTNIAKYKGYDFTLVKISASDEDRAEAVKFALSCIGQGYGWTTILSIALSLVSG